MKKITIICSIVAMGFLIACGGGNNSSDNNAGGEAAKTTSSTSDYDPHRGEGKWNNDNVKVGASLDAKMAAEGKKIFDVKCASCHKLTDERLVGPGWKGVTSRVTAPWILNFITNPDPMIDKDPELQAQLEICLVRMPNQNLTDGDARNILEFMRENDGVK
jgi:hypothetical protein